MNRRSILKRALAGVGCGAQQDEWVVRPYFAKEPAADERVERHRYVDDTQNHGAPSNWWVDQWEKGGNGSSTTILFERSPSV